MVELMSLMSFSRRLNEKNNADKVVLIAPIGALQL